MDEIEMYEKLSAIQYFLDKHESQPEPPHWLTGHPDHDESESFCFGCMKDIAPDGDWGDPWDGGFSIEEDGSEVCEKCGKLLQYTLTDYGVDYEMDFFADYPLENLDDPDTCYQLGRIAYGVYTDEQKLRFLEIMKPVMASIESY